VPTTGNELRGVRLGLSKGSHLHLHRNATVLGAAVAQLVHKPRAPSYTEVYRKTNCTRLTWPCLLSPHAYSSGPERARICPSPEQMCCTRRRLK
jgi:hypothetical protein